MSLQFRIDDQVFRVDDKRDATEAVVHKYDAFLNLLCAERFAFQRDAVREAVRFLVSDKYPDLERLFEDTEAAAVMGAAAAVNAVFFNKIADKPEGPEREAFVQQLRKEYEEDISLEKIASELIVDAVLPENELRAQLVARFAFAKARVPRETLDAAFDLQHELRHVDAIFARVLAQG